MKNLNYMSLFNLNILIIIILCEEDRKNIFFEILNLICFMFCMKVLEDMEKSLFKFLKLIIGNCVIVFK